MTTIDPARAETDNRQPAPSGRRTTATRGTRIIGIGAIVLNGAEVGEESIVAAGALMVVEMSVMAFAPTGNPTLLFALFLVNRVLSGLAEAAASGADEALAYDSLLEVGRAHEWPNVLVLLQRIATSVATSSAG